MKSTVLLLMIVMMSLVGCSADESSQEQADAGKDFAVARANIVDATQGFIDRESTDTPRFAGTLTAYQQKELAEAQSQLEGLTGRGSATQQASAAIALAEVRAAQARHAARLALDGRVEQDNPDRPYVKVGWANIATLTEQTMNTLIAVRRAQANAQAMLEVNEAPVLADVQDRLTQLQSRRADINAGLRDLKGQAQQLTADRQRLEQQRLTRLNKAEDLRGRSFASTGQARFDLYTEAATLTRGADQLGAEIEKLNTELQRVRSRVGIREAELAQVEHQIASAQELIGGINTRGNDRQAQAQQFAQQASQLADQLVQQLTQRNREYSEQVMARHDQAISQLSAAVDVLSQAMAQAPGHLRPRLTVEHAIKQAELAHVTRQSGATDASHARFFEAVQSQADQGFPDAQATKIRAMAEAAGARADQSQNQAGTSLTEAAESLSEAADATTNDKVTRAVLTQIVSVNETLAAETGELAYRNAAQQAQDRIDSLGSN